MLPNTSRLSLNAGRGEAGTDASFPQRLVKPVETLDDERPLGDAVLQSIRKYKDVVGVLLREQQSTMDTTTRRSWEALRRAMQRVELASPKMREAAQAQLVEVREQAVRDMQKVNRNAETSIRKLSLREAYLKFASRLPTDYRIQMGAELASQAWKFFRRSLFAFGDDTLEKTLVDDGVEFDVNFMDAVESDRHIGLGWGSRDDLDAWSRLFGDQKVPRGWQNEFDAKFRLLDSNPGSAIVRLSPLATAYLQVNGKGGEAIFSLKATLLMNFKEQFEQNVRRIGETDDHDAFAFVSNLPYSYRIPDNERFRFRESVVKDSIIPMLEEARAAGLVHGDRFAFFPDMDETLVRQRQPFLVGMEQPALHRPEFAAPSP